MANLQTLLAVTPIDGRYYGKTASLSDYFSEYALIKYRVRIEIEYFIALCKMPLPQLEGVLNAELEIHVKGTSETSGK